MRHWFDPWVRKLSCRKAWQPTSVLLPRESPWTEEPGGLQSTASHRIGHEWMPMTQQHRVGHDWSDLACMHARRCSFNASTLKQRGKSMYRFPGEGPAWHLKQWISPTSLLHRLWLTPPSSLPSLFSTPGKYPVPTLSSCAYTFLGFRPSCISSGSWSWLFAMPFWHWSCSKGWARHLYVHCRQFLFPNLQLPFKTGSTFSP